MVWGYANCERGEVLSSQFLVSYTPRMQGNLQKGRRELTYHTGILSLKYMVSYPVLEYCIVAYASIV